MEILDKIIKKINTWKTSIANEWHRLVFKFWPSLYLTEEQKSRIFPLGYAFPDELFLASMSPKKQLWAEVIPGLRQTYRFSDESSYYKMYADARFAFTWKKGGWDCLRHYEILANGTIPAFPDLVNCPKDTLTHLPKDLIIQANKTLLPWKDTSDYHIKYEDFLTKILNYTRDHASCSAVARDFLKNLGANPSQKILFLNCDLNVNYSREFLFIGLSRVIQENEGICFGYPKLDFLYNDFPQEKADKCYGKGFGYTKRIKALPENSPFPQSILELEKSIADGYWDFVVYGKMGLDEGKLGTVPTCPFWETVSKTYDKDSIAFVYGGDQIQNLKDMGSKHSRHLVKHAKLGKCFVRELELNK